MNESVKTKWVQALRNGGYNQTRGYLANEDGYCCLGVLCEVAIKEGLEIEVEEDDSDGRVYYSGEESQLPVEVADWAEISRLGEREYSNPDSNLDDFDSLASVNDYQPSPFTFWHIAHIIEQEF